MSEGKRPERYDTVFLVSQLQGEGKRNKTIGLSIGAVIVVLVLYALFVYKPAEAPIAPHAGAPAVAPGTEVAPAAVPTAPAPAPTH